MKCHSRAVNHANFRAPKGMNEIYKAVAPGLGDGVTIQSASNFRSASNFKCPQEKTVATTPVPTALLPSAVAEAAPPVTHNATATATATPVPAAYAASTITAPVPAC
ncbi:MAG: hypothetical protein ACI8RD_002850 [Bacillariaceae sp.]|jgi:hypothetical protein